ncbi:hypothetical protein OGATHE_003271 [Ogataea polymorpha]|uniref:Uncharacterized protein n=1 Tax=Ogataea polymorpha TaxID=460523 RepID=A0A9P8T388_9ASCO|nr:hypothetical protein OGATHE_003271 [Ogataea polymorpha]
MKNLLLSKSKCGSTSNNAVILVTPSLDLRHCFTTSVGTSFKIGVKFFILGKTIEFSREIFPHHSQLTKSLVAEHISCIPVDGAVAIQKDFVQAIVKGIVASTGSSTDSTIGKSACSIRIQRVSTTSSKVEPIRKFIRAWKSVFDSHIVTLSRMSVLESDTAVLRGIRTG